MAGSIKSNEIYVCCHKGRYFAVDNITRKPISKHMNRQEFEGWYHSIISYNADLADRIERAERKGYSDFHDLTPFVSWIEKEGYKYSELLHFLNTVTFTTTQETLDAIKLVISGMASVVGEERKDYFTVYIDLTHKRYNGIREALEHLKGTGL